MPIAPVEQKAHPRAQPTCDETHSEVCVSLIGSSTHSTLSPSRSESSSFCVPSSERVSESTVPEHTDSHAGASSRRSLGLSCFARSANMRKRERSASVEKES